MPPKYVTDEVPGGSIISDPTQCASFQIAWELDWELDDAVSYRNKTITIN